MPWNPGIVGVEHTNYRGEFKLAHSILQAYKEWDPKFLQDPKMPPWARRYHTHIAALKEAQRAAMPGPKPEVTRVPNSRPAFAVVSALNLPPRSRFKVGASQLLRNARDHVAWMAAPPHTSTRIDKK